MSATTIFMTLPGVITGSAPTSTIDQDRIIWRDTAKLAAKKEEAICCFIQKESHAGLLAAVEDSEGNALLSPHFGRCKKRCGKKLDEAKARRPLLADAVERTRVGTFRRLMFLEHYLLNPAPETAPASE